MKTIQKNGFRLEIPFNDVYTDYFASLYDTFNLDAYPNALDVPKGFETFVNHVYSYGNFKLKEIAYSDMPQHDLTNALDRHAILGFSGGLDSVAQAIYLKEAGYVVHLFELRNANTYENGLGHKAAVECARLLNMDFIEARIVKTTNKHNEYKQTRPENPIKNQLILAMMVDVCIENNWKYISLGDDFDLGMKDAVFGINFTDARELTQAFLSGMYRYCDGLKFLKIDSTLHDKFDRLMTLKRHGLLDSYYSCVLAGRFNQQSHSRIERKFNVKLFKNNCGACRKCCMHNLLLHYKNEILFPGEYVDFCWEKMYRNSYSADYEFFKPELSIEERIQNLFEY